MSSTHKGFEDQEAEGILMGWSSEIPARINWALGSIVLGLIVVLCMECVLFWRDFGQQSNLYVVPPTELPMPNGTAGSPARTGSSADDDFSAEPGIHLLASKP